jgi:hypothetical protein
MLPEERLARQREISRRWWSDPANRDRRNQIRREHQQRNTEYCQRIKLERGCMDCGYRAHAEALDFDHRDPDTKGGNIAQMTSSASLERIIVEIEKCDVVCANCHRVRSARRRAA